MKTGVQVRDRVLQLLNYTDSDGRVSTAMYGDIAARSLALVNQIYAELHYAYRRDGFEELADLGDEIALPEWVINDVMPYGVAMLTAQSIGDADNQSMFTDLYNQKRAKLTHRVRREDVMPRAL